MTNGYTFSKKIDAILLAAGGQKVETINYTRTHEWVEYESAYLREFKGDGRYVDGPIQKVKKSFFTFRNGAIVMESAGKGRAKISSIVGDEMEIETDAFKNSEDVEEILDLFDTQELRAALEEKAVQEAIKAELELQKEEEAKAKDRKRQKMKTLVEEAFTRIRKGEVSYIKGDFKFEVFGNIDASQRPIKRGITIQKQRLGSIERAEDRCWDPDTVVCVEDTADFRRAAIDPQEWFPEGVITIEEFYEYIISY